MFQQCSTLAPTSLKVEGSVKCVLIVVRLIYTRLVWFYTGQKILSNFMPYFLSSRWAQGMLTLRLGSPLLWMERFRGQNKGKNFDFLCCSAHRKKRLLVRLHSLLARKYVVSTCWGRTRPSHMYAMWMAGVSSRVPINIMMMRQESWDGER